MPPSSWTVSEAQQSGIGYTFSHVATCSPTPVPARAPRTPSVNAPDQVTDRAGMPTRLDMPMDELHGQEVSPTEEFRRKHSTVSLIAMPAHRAPRVDPSQRLLLFAAIGLLTCALIWVASRPHPPEGGPLDWSAIAPPETTALHPWRWLVIHHSASRAGDARTFDGEHLGRGWDGIGYHFVIGNGSPLPLGYVEATYRWRLQSHGAHAGPGPEQAPYNQDGLGICLVGNFADAPLDPFQERRLVDLCVQLIHHVPTLSVNHIIGHRDVPGKATACPGRNVDLERIRFLVREELIRRGMTVR